MKIKNSDLNPEEIKSIKDSFFHIYHSFLDEGFLSKDFVGCLFKWGVQLHISEEELKFISPNYQEKEITDQDSALEHLFNLVYMIYLDGQILLSLNLNLAVSDIDLLLEYHNQHL